jgi:hypothetical protein
MLSQNGEDIWVSETILANATASEMQTGLQPYYNQFSLTIEVLKLGYDINGAETEDYTQVTTNVYTVSLLNQIEGYSASAVSVST